MKTKIGFFRPIRKLTKSVTGLFLKSPGWRSDDMSRKNAILFLEGSRSACWHKPGIRCGGENSEEKELEKKVQATVTELQELLRQKQSEGADVSKALELDRQSKEAFDQGRP